MKAYVDRALSARTADRPDFQRMIADSAKGLFDAVLVWKLDRFSRDRYGSAHYKHILKKNGVRVISIKENISDGPKASFWNPCWKDMPNITPPSLRKRSAGGSRRMQSNV